MRDRQPPLDVFVGRATELARVAEVITRVEGGEPWLVSIEGDPGVGKTALARRCLAGTPGLRVLSARADQAEADLDFGIVDQLLRAAGAVFPTFPSAGATGSPESSFAVGAHLLEVVGDQQATAAVAIVVDDLQWADRRSIEALTFVVRRLSVDPVLTMVTYRGPGDQLDEAAQQMLRSVDNRLDILLGGLSQDEVAALAAAVTAGPLDGEAVQWLYRGTGGHALYLRTVLSRDAVYAGITATRRRVLHERAASVVSESASWEHRVAALEHPDEGLAAELERLADEEVADGRLARAATHLRWASDISPALADRERRMLTAAMHLMLAEESRGLTLRQVVEESALSPLRNCVLGTMAFSAGQLAEAQLRFSEALAQARDDPDSRPLAALIANKLSRHVHAARGRRAGAGLRPVGVGHRLPGRSGRQPDPHPDRDRRLRGGWPARGPGRTEAPGCRCGAGQPG